MPPSSVSPATTIRPSGSAATPHPRCAPARASLTMLPAPKLSSRAPFARSRTTTTSWSPAASTHPAMTTRPAVSSATAPASGRRAAHVRRGPAARRGEALLVEAAAAAGHLGDEELVVTFAGDEGRVPVRVERRRVHVLLAAEVDELDARIAGCAVQRAVVAVAEQEEFIAYFPPRLPGPGPAGKSSLPPSSMRWTP